MFASATGYIFSFGLSRRRHEPPFKPGGSVGALVGRPGFRAGFARIRARGRGRGSVGAACSSRKKPLDLQSSYHLIYSLARPPRCAAAPCSPAYCVSQRQGGRPFFFLPACGRLSPSQEPLFSLQTLVESACAAAPILVSVLVARIPARSKSTRKGHD